jgi:hypothetical protein
MSWRTTLTVLTVLTALTLVARFSTPELILIVRVPAAPLSGEGYFDAQHEKERMDRLGATEWREPPIRPKNMQRRTFKRLVDERKVRGRSHPAAAFRGAVEHAR